MFSARLKMESFEEGYEDTPERSPDFSDIKMEEEDQDDSLQETSQDLDLSMPETSSSTTLERYQEILNEYGLEGIIASEIETMERKEFEGLLARVELTEEQKVVLKDVRAKILKNTRAKKWRNGKRSLVVAQFNLPKNFKDEDAKALLDSQGLGAIKLSELIEMCGDNFMKLKKSLNPRQSETVSFLRTKLRNRIHARRQKAVKKLLSEPKNSRWLPSSAEIDLEGVRTDDLEEELRKIECPHTLKEVLAMSTADFLKYKEKHEKHEREVLSRTRTLALKRQRHARKLQGKAQICPTATVDFVELGPISLSMVEDRALNGIQGTKPKPSNSRSMSTKMTEEQESIIKSIGNLSDVLNSEEGEEDEES